MGWGWKRVPFGKPRWPSWFENALSQVNSWVSLELIHLGESGVRVREKEKQKSSVSARASGMRKLSGWVHVTKIREADFARCGGTRDPVVRCLIRITSKKSVGSGPKRAGDTRSLPASGRLRETSTSQRGRSTHYGVPNSSSSQRMSRHFSVGIHPSADTRPVPMQDSRWALLMNAKLWTHREGTADAFGAGGVAADWAFEREARHGGKAARQQGRTARAVIRARTEYMAW